MKALITCPMILALLAPLPLLAQSGYIPVRVENTSLKPTYLEIRDSLCRSQISSECRAAVLLVGSKKCTGQDRRSDKCRQAKEISSSSECLPGMLFHDRLGSGESVALDICTDHTGKGRIATRHSKTAPWVQRHWVEPGEKIEIK